MSRKSEEAQIRAVLEKASKATLVGFLSNLLAWRGHSPVALEAGLHEWELEEAVSKARAAVMAVGRKSDLAHKAWEEALKASDAGKITPEERWRAFDAYMVIYDEHKKAYEVHKKAFEALIEARRNNFENRP